MEIKMPSKPQLEQIIEDTMEFIAQLEEQASRYRAILTEAQALLRVGSYDEILPAITRLKGNIQTEADYIKWAREQVAKERAHGLAREDEEDGASSQDD